MQAKAVKVNAGEPKNLQPLFSYSLRDTKFLQTGTCLHMQGSMGDPVRIIALKDLFADLGSGELREPW